jgi:hypothetical protein
MGYFGIEITYELDKEPLNLVILTYMLLGMMNG